MFNYLLKIFRYHKHKSVNNNTDNTSSNYNKELLSSNLSKNLETLRTSFGASQDIIIREFNFGYNKQTKGALIFIEGMVNRDLIDSSIMKPLMYNICLTQNRDSSDTSDIDIISKNLLSTANIKKVSTLGNLFDNLFSGDAILLIDCSKEALAIHAKQWDKRTVSEPLTESVVRGPREGFTENLRTNTTLLRRKIKNPDLQIETFTIGERTRTNVCVAYVKDIAPPKLITEIKNRLDKINIDSVLESGYIEAFIEDAPYSIFSTVANSEKPDVVAAKILEGRAAIFVDGTPFVLTVPMLFIESFQSSEDYYSRPYFGSIIRLIRFLTFIISILSPAVYVALSTFHQELIPTQLLFTMAAGHQGIPFPAVAEAGFMLILFEILRESGVRLPKPVGSAVSIVGALVIGESAVSAGLISSIMVIVVALTAISSFVVPAQTDSASIIRYLLLVLSGFMGGFGIVLGLLIILIHLASIRSFGIPYLSPIAPLTSQDLKDTFVRVPLWAMKLRPKLIGLQNPKREKKISPPSAKDDENNS